MDPRLSIVVISRNEEAAIARCLGSLVECLRAIPHEIILVDSASSDATITIASGFPAKIFQITDTDVISPGAGRYVGSAHARGEFVLFIDGDMTLHAGWVERAIEKFADSTVGGVAGYISWIRPGEILEELEKGKRPFGQAEFLGGAALYKRAALTRAGTYHPWLRGEEEREIGYRLRKAGFVLLRDNDVMVYHLAKPRTLGERLEKARYYTGVGQILRHYGWAGISGELVRDNVARLALVPLFLLMVIIGIALLPASAPFFAVLVALGILGGAFLLAWKGFTRSARELRAEAASLWWIVRGCIAGMAAPQSFPMDAVREIPNAVGQPEGHA
jgi:glycosyltransferase involved in cell wall biosynthesis